MFRKTLNQGVKRAVRVRLEALLSEELESYKDWIDNWKPRMNRTRQRDVERNYNKRIQAFRITIYALTPYTERTHEIPTFVVRKDKKE